MEHMGINMEMETSMWLKPEMERKTWLKLWFAHGKRQLACLSLWKVAHDILMV